MGKLYSILYTPYSYFILTATAFAQGGSGVTPTGGGSGRTPSFELPNPLKTTSITDLINRVINYLIIYIGPPILTLMILYGAFQILTAGANPEQFKAGRKTILYAIIGYAILLVSGGVIYLIGELLGFGTQVKPPL